MRPTRILAASTTLALSLLAVPVLAEDGKAFSGSACQATFASSPPTLFRNVGRVLNNGTSAISVTCPAMKDIEAGRMKRGEVRVLDQNPITGADVVCTLSSLKSDGSVHQSQTLRSIGSSTAVQLLTFAGHTASAKGSYNLACDIPAFPTGFGPSRIVMYNVVEE
jgi:hypothetical protein